MFLKKLLASVSALALLTTSSIAAFAVDNDYDIVLDNDKPVIGEALEASVTFDNTPIFLPIGRSFRVYEAGEENLLNNIDSLDIGNEGGGVYTFNAPSTPGEYTMRWLIPPFDGSDPNYIELYSKNFTVMELPASVQVIFFGDDPQYDKGASVYFIVWDADKSAAVALPEGWSFEVSHHTEIPLDVIDGTTDDGKVSPVGSTPGIYEFVAPNVDRDYSVNLYNAEDEKVGVTDTFTVGIGSLAIDPNLLGGLDLSDFLVVPNPVVDLADVIGGGAVPAEALELVLQFKAGQNGNYAAGDKGVSALSFDLTSPQDIRLEKVVMALTGDSSSVKEVRLESDDGFIVGELVGSEYTFTFAGDGFPVNVNEQPELWLSVDIAADASDGELSFDIVADDDMTFDTAVAYGDLQFPLKGKTLKISANPEDNGGDGDGEPEIDKLFDDVDSNYDNYEAIKWAKDNEVIKGYEDGEFKPENAISRVEVLKTVLKASGIEVPAEVPEDGLDRFTDIAGEDWSKVYMFKALEKEIFIGDGGLELDTTTARPGAKPNAAEALKLAFETAKVASAYELKEYTDEEVEDAGLEADAWFRNYWLAAVENVLLEDGIGAGDLLNRAQFVEILYRMNQKNIFELS